MIAPKEVETGMNVLSIGLQPEEQALVSTLCQEFGGKLHMAKDEIDMNHLARETAVDLCILAQSEAVSDPSYLVWLLRGITSNYHIILIYSSLSEEETERLDRFEATMVLMRPLDREHLKETIANIFSGKTEKRERFWHSLARYLPFHRHVKVQ